MNPMNSKSLVHMAMAGLLTVGLTAPVHAADQSIFELGAAEAKQTSRDFKEFKPAPAKIKTNFGTLEFTGSAYPTPETVKKVYDELELQSRPYPSISSQQTPAPKANADGSVDLYFAPEKPKGIAEQNWVPTLPEQGFFSYIRYYGPLKAFNDQSWKPNDVVLVK